MNTKISIRLAAVALAAASGSAAMASNFSYPNFTSVAGLSLVGAANTGPGVFPIEGNTISLTQPGQFSSVGAVWKADKQDVGLSFVTDFRFRVRDRGNNTAADGFAFVIQNVSNTEIGGAGGAIGYGTNPFGGPSGIANSIAVVFDSFDNNGTGFVQSGTSNAIQVQSRGPLPNVPTADANLGVATAAEAFADGSIRSVRISYSGNMLSVFYQNLSSPVLTVAVNLSNQIALSGNQAYVGLTSATGGAAQRHEILDWSFNGTVPAPGAASLLGLGALVGLRRRRAR